MTSQPFAAQGLSRVSMCQIPSMPLTGAVRTLNVPNVNLGVFYPGFCLRSSATCWVRHSHHASTSRSSTLLLTHVCLPSIPPLLASDPTVSAAAVSQLCYRRHVCHGKRFRFVGVHRRQSMLLAGLHCQHRRILASIDVMKERWFMQELHS